MTSEEHYRDVNDELVKKARIQLILDNLRAALDEGQRQASLRRWAERAEISAIIAEMEAEFN